MHACSPFIKHVQMPPLNGHANLSCVTRASLLVWVVTYVHTLCMQAVKVLASVGICTGSPESSLLINPYKPSYLFVGHRQTSAKPDQTPQNAASDQGLHCLLTEYSVETKIMRKNTTQHPLKLKWIGPIDKQKDPRNDQSRPHCLPM